MKKTEKTNVHQVTALTPLNTKPSDLLNQSSKCLLKGLLIKDGSQFFPLTIQALPEEYQEELVGMTIDNDLDTTSGPEFFEAVQEQIRLELLSGTKLSPRQEAFRRFIVQVAAVNALDELLWNFTLAGVDSILLEKDYEVYCEEFGVTDEALYDLLDTYLVEESEA